MQRTLPSTAPACSFPLSDLPPPCPGSPIPFFTPSIPSRISFKPV